jgi:hypothetical protein
MDFYILAKCTAILFLSLQNPTTLVFEEPIEFMSLGKNGSVEVHRSKNKKILVLQAKRELEAQMVVLTKNQNFQFKIKSLQSNYHPLVHIHAGAINKTYVNKLETSDFKILEGDSSILFQNKKEEPILVNDVLVKREEYFSKGSPLLMNEQRIFN